MLEKKEIKIYLDMAHEIRESHSLIDMHVHPFEIIYKGLKYNKKNLHYGVYSLNNQTYVPPQITENVIEKKINEKFEQYGENIKRKMLLLKAMCLYAHVGPEVIGDHMKICGVDKVLLLPVLTPDETSEVQMEMMAEIFGEDKRFIFGYCVPNYIQNNQISKVVKNAILKYNIKAIKIHPNISGIDLTTNFGRERIERILEASRDTGLMVIVHGGRSPDINNSETIAYSVLKNLQAIDWGITREPVVIAHAGTFGHDSLEVVNDVLPVLNKLLSKYNNLLVDVSAVNIETLCLILKNIDFDRILFGSDSFYKIQWHGVVGLLYALKKTKNNCENGFVKIASVNPMRYVIGEDRKNARNNISKI